MKSKISNSVYNDDYQEVSELLNEIFSDLKRERDIKDVLQGVSIRDASFYHYSIGLYIRNKFLYPSKHNVRLLSAYYGKDHIDSISTCILTSFLDYGMDD